MNPIYPFHTANLPLQDSRADHKKTSIWTIFGGVERPQKSSNCVSPALEQPKSQGSGKGTSLDFERCETNKITGWYEGRCPQTGEWLRLPRTEFVEAIALGLMAQLAQDQSFPREGKMYGVLLVALPDGVWGVLRAFSGLLNGREEMPAWVPPIPGRGQVALEEARTLTELDCIKRELMTLQQLPEREKLTRLSSEFAEQLAALSAHHRDRKQQRQQQRQILAANLEGAELAQAIAALEAESQRDGMERRDLKRQRDAALRPLQAAIVQAEERMRSLKQERKRLSRQLQSQMFATYQLSNFAGHSASLQALMPEGLPTGTGECCAPKLLHYAATHHLKPLAMAEFWWGDTSSDGDKVSGQFYDACVERCQPLMGFLLSGLSHRLPVPQEIAQEEIAQVAQEKITQVTQETSQEISETVTQETSQIIFQETSQEISEIQNNRSAKGFPISPKEAIPLVYEDDVLLAINKPAGLLSVPGRTGDRQDSVLSRLRAQFPDQSFFPVHRLDQATSGVLLFARDRPTYRLLSQQFQDRLVKKVYEAVLAGVLEQEHGTIDLPLWGDPGDRPKQSVNFEHGKPSLTHFQVIKRTAALTLVEFSPQTGRTHQLRVHAAAPEGLGIPILGDRLYGCMEGNRLYLHARELWIIHPQSGDRLFLEAPTPFIPLSETKLR